MAQSDALDCVAKLSPAQCRAIIALLGSAKTKSESVKHAGIADRSTAISRPEGSRKRSRSANSWSSPQTQTAYLAALF